MKNSIYSALASAVYYTQMQANGRSITRDDQRLRLGGMYEDWMLRDYAAGGICRAAGQVWECYRAFSAQAYPQVAPEDPAFRTFFRPLHGTTVTTAREFVQPQGAYDMYRAGEYIWFNDRVYLCKADTAYSPADYAQAWEVQ